MIQREYRCPSCGQMRVQVTQRRPHPPRECGACGWKEDKGGKAK